jgi:hypothetical protein
MCQFEQKLEEKKPEENAASTQMINELKEKLFQQEQKVNELGQQAMQAQRNYQMQSAQNYEKDASIDQLKEVI